MILSKMYRGFHGRWHKYSPDHRVDVDLKHIVSGLTTEFLSYVRVDGQHCSWRSPSCRRCPGTRARFFPVWHIWERDAVLSFKKLVTGLTVLVRSKFELCALSVFGLWGSLESSTPSSPVSFFLRQPLRQGLRSVNWTTTATRKHWKACDVEQKEKKIPFITCEIAFR